jgi:two-component system, LytTR family, response regulator
MTADLAHIRVAIIDDEPLARDGVRMLLGQDPEIAIIAEAGTADAAITLIRRERPDLIFLDVQMPGRNGFDVLAAIPAEELPAVIFVTAYDQYALRAFEIHALDYLLKPYLDERFFEALRRAKTHLRLSRTSVLTEKLLSALSAQTLASAPPPKFLERIAIRDLGRVVFLDVAEIDWIEAADYYVQIHAGGREYLHRETMQSLDERLDPARFLRIHRSLIVNQSRIKELRTPGRRDLLVVMADGTSLKVARSHRDKVQALR